MRTILFVLLASTFALAAADFSGTWSGTLERDGAKAPLSLTLVPDEGGLTGSVLFNGGAAARRPIEKAALDGDHLTFESRDIEGNVTGFHLTLSGTQISGEANFGGEVWTVHLATKIPPMSVPSSSSSPNFSSVYRVGGGISAPVLISKSEPQYSEEARENRLEGIVVLYVQINPSGQATNIKLVRSLGMGLDEKAVESVKKWKFKPGYKGDQPVTVEATIEVNFKL